MSSRGGREGEGGGRKSRVGGMGRGREGKEGRLTGEGGKRKEIERKW